MNMNLSRFQKGVILLAAGIILLLYSTGLITTGLHIIFIVTSLLMIVCGFYLLNGPQYLRSWIQNLGKNNAANKTASKPNPSTEKAQHQSSNPKNNNEHKK